VYDFLVRVPFIIAGAAVPTRGRVSEQVRQVDIFPTLLAAAGLESPHTVDGQDLFAASYRPRPAMMRAVSAFDSEEKWLDGVRYDGWKFVKGRGRALRQLFDLDSDPLELHNVVDEYPKKAAELETILDEFVAREDNTREGPSEEAKRRMTERLEHLGYL
jgi:arylsulfatase A-like enzyme